MLMDTERWPEKGDDNLLKSINSNVFREISNEQPDPGLYKTSICGLMEIGSLSICFQPIFSAKDGTLYGYEALTRIDATSQHPFSDIEDLFRKARRANAISDLDIHCGRKAVTDAARLGIKKTGRYLFINICPMTFVAAEHRDCFSDNAAQWGLLKDMIYLEFSEKAAVSNYNLFREAIRHYREQGFKIAIDNFGAGHGGLRTLSIIEPDFVKIDRQLIANIDKAMLHLNLVESIVTACHRMGIKAIAEGVERKEELDIVRNLGFEALQGNLIGKPSPSLAVNGVLFTTLNNIRIPGSGREDKASRHFTTIGDISRNVEPIIPSHPFSKAVNRFTVDPELRGLPVVENGAVLGMLHRTRFTEQQIIGRFGYGMYLNSYKNIGDIMERNFLLVEASASLENVAQKVNSREAAFLYDDIVVTAHGKYLGTVAISDLLEAMTERSISTAKNCNPLTGLPGNVSIQKEVEKKLSQNMQFDVCYIDLDNFKPYNDCYGFEKGDMVIKCLADIIINAVNAVDKNIFNFAGHIGGDDFILLTLPQTSVKTSEKIVRDFSIRLPDFHGAEDFKKGTYSSKNRKGETDTFDLLSLSIGIVSTELRKIDSYAQLSSIAMEVKKSAKMQKGSSIVRDRRTHI